uniref:Protein toll n=2 Tax=Cacopsylla melanoneura TaxID=428564 RepID=A0A8D8TJS1_9HEMI
MTMKILVWILLALSVHLNAEDEDLTCRRSNCACYRLISRETKERIRGDLRNNNMMRIYPCAPNPQTQRVHVPFSPSLCRTSLEFSNHYNYNFPDFTSDIAMRCSHELYRQNLSLSQSLSLRGSNDPDAEVNELLSFPFIELSYSFIYMADMQFSIHCFNFNLENMSTANTPLFDLIPKFDSSGNFLRLVRFEGCPVPDEPFETLFNIINATNVQSLKFSFSPSNIILSPPVNITRDLFSNLPSLIELDISDNNISALEPGVFQHLIGLEYLHLSNNKITTLDQDIYKNLTSLTLLAIDNNRLFNLTYDVFTNLPINLISLNISSNNISVLPSGVFDKLSNLKKLDISNNNISVLPNRVFDHLGMMNEIWANGNTFKEFPDHLFSRTNEIKIIYLQYQRPSRAIPEDFLLNVSKFEELRESPIKDVPSYLFWNASNLNTIYLTGHKELVSLPGLLFQDCKELSVLDLSDNGLESLSGYLFMSLKKLSHLNLSRNRFQSIIFFYTFGGITSLEQLNLSYNGITHISNLWLYYLCRTNERLESIDLSNNFLKTYDPIYDQSRLYECHRLKTIKLSNNRISRIDMEWILNMNGLETLDLRWNNITSIPDYVLSTVSSNMTMDLSYNQIEIVDFTSTPAVSDKKYDSKRRNIILNENPIACNSSNYDLFRFIQGMMPLETDKSTAIQFETNNINTCKPSNTSINTVDPTKLTCDTVAGCPSSCKCSYSPHYDQMTVNCTSANLTHMPQHLNITLEDKRAIPLNSRKTNRTIKLILRNNSIQDFLKDSPEIYAWVKVLDLSFNKIKDSKDILQHLPRLETLNLSHNHLESLHEDFISQLSPNTRISSLYLSGNKWKCDCNITDLHNFLSSYKKEIVKDSKEIMCDNLRLYEMNKEDFCPLQNTNIVLVCIVLATLGVLFGLLVTCFYYKYQHEIKVWLFAHQILLCWVSEEDIDSDKVYDAFVSYNEEDFRFVVKTLIPELEKSFRICHHERDFVPGEFITEQIHEKVSQSRRTIIVLTEHFLKSRWCDLEFRTAHAQAMKDNCARVIILIYGDMPPQEAMPEKMKTYMSMNTYIKWGDKWFWDKLKYALPRLSLRRFGKNSQGPRPPEP